MKKVFLISIILFCTLSCGEANETKRLESYLNSFGYDIKSFKIVCFVPADGCNACIDPFLEYSKKSRNEYLLVLSSIYIKSIDFIIGQKSIEETKILSDSKNLAASSGLVHIIYPMIYFLKNGSVVKIADTSNISDKISLLKEIDTFLSK